VDGAGELRKLRASDSLTTGTISPFKRHGNAQVDVVVVVDRTVDQRRVEDGNLRSASTAAAAIKGI